jgi:hypothetical protein
MGWFIPVGVLIGAAGTKTALRSHHTVRANNQAPFWWLLLLLSWMPFVCWVLAQFVEQW